MFGVHNLHLFDSQTNGTSKVVSTSPHVALACHMWRHLFKVNGTPTTEIIKYYKTKNKTKLMHSKQGANKENPKETKKKKRPGLMGISVDSGRSRTT